MFPMDNYVCSFGPGDSFGEISLITGFKRTGTIICDENTYLLEMSTLGYESIRNVKILKKSPFNFYTLKEYFFQIKIKISLERKTFLKYGLYFGIIIVNLTLFLPCI